MTLLSRTAQSVINLGGPGSGPRPGGGSNSYNAEALASKHLGVDSLEPKNSGADFHDVGVVGVKHALNEAHTLGGGTPGPKQDADVSAIAKKHLNLDTLDQRGRDHLDFGEQSVWGIKKALDAAHAAGKASK